MTLFFAFDRCEVRETRVQLAQQRCNTRVSHQEHPTAGSGNICSEGLNHLRYSDLNPVKNRDFFSETSPAPRTFVPRGRLHSYCFWMPQICRSEYKIKSASIFVQQLAARNFGGQDSVSQSGPQPELDI